MRLFHKNIIAQIALLLAVFLVSLTGLNIGHGLLERRLEYLQRLQENEQVKLELANLLQKNLLEINVKLQEMSNANSLGAMSRDMELVGLKAGEIADILGVIEKGGVKVEAYPVNFGNEEIIKRTLAYSNYNPQRINLDVIEIRAKLTELDDIVREFEALVRNKVADIKTGNVLKIAETIRKTSNFYKGIEPFFVRLLENSNRLYYESQQEKERIRKVYTAATGMFGRVKLISTAASLGFTLLLGFMILQSSRKILLERQQYQQQLIASNENLELKVQRRTTELEREVAERKQKEQHITEQAEFLFNIIESLAHPFYVIDAESYRIVLANSAAGLVEQESSITCHALTHQQDSPCSQKEHPCPLQIVKKTGQAVALEHVHQDAQGRETIVEVHGYPVFDAHGKMVQMIEYSLDITAKKQAENALLEAKEQLEEKVRERTAALEEQILERKKAQLTLIKSERHYRRLIENISDVITIIDENGVISYTSPSAAKVLRHPPQTFAGRNVRELIHAEDLTYVDIRTLSERYGQTRPVEYRVLAGDGTYRVLESFIQKFEKEDRSCGYILSSRDITARKQAEEQAGNLQMVIEQSPSSVVVTDTDGVIEYVNPAFERITGYRAKEVIGENPRFLKSGETPEECFQDLWKTVTAGNIWRGEFVNKKKNGEFYEESVLIAPLKNQRGEVTNYVAVKENISALRRAQRQAEQANRAKSDFLSRMSHELRTPLNAINGFSQLMLKSRKHPLSDKQKEMAQQIRSAGNHLLRLINEILDLAKIEAGEFSLSPEKVDPKIVLNDCIALVGQLAAARSVTVADRTANPLPPLLADETRLKQVLINLLSNAVKYNRTGGRVDIHAETDGGFLRIAVKDNGIGIPLEKQADIFTPFVRTVENPEDVEGTGIGMSITKQLIEKMGGEIGFESLPGQGSSFWFKLPTAEHVQETVAVAVAAAEEETTAPGIMIPDRQGAKKRILYIEDNPTNILFIRNAVADLGGFRVDVARSGEDGLSAVREQVPDVVLLDLNLPGIDGYEVYRQLKAHKTTAFVPVVVVSADAMESTRQKVGKLGFDGYLTKPVDIDLLRQTLTTVLEKE